MNKNTASRFEIIHEERLGTSDGARIIRDTQTGVCYLQHYLANSTAITPLLNADGTPLTAG